MKECRYLRIIVTNRCNLQCFYCHEEGQENNKKTFLKRATENKN